MSCRFEPVTSATQTLYRNLCERPLTRRDQLRFSDCLNKVSNASHGQQCLQAFGRVDLLAGNAAERICLTIDEILACSAAQIQSECGDEALLHVYDTHNGWMQAFNATCILRPPNLLSTTTETTASTPKRLIEEAHLPAKIEEDLDSEVDTKTETTIEAMESTTTTVSSTTVATSTIVIERTVIRGKRVVL